MGTPEGPTGPDTTQGLDIAKLSRTHGELIASASITNVIRPIQTTLDALAQGLSQTESRRPFMIPSFQMGDVNHVAFLSLFFTLMYAHSWLRENAIVVIFTDRSGGWSFGIANTEDKQYWEGDEGKAHLQTGNTKIYTVKDYSDIAYAELEKLGKTNHT